MSKPCVCLYPVLDFRSICAPTFSAQHNSTNGREGCHGPLTPPPWLSSPSTILYIMRHSSFAQD